MAVDPNVVALVEEFVALVSPLRRAMESEERLVALLGHFGWVPPPTAVAGLQVAFSAAGEMAAITDLAAKLASNTGTVDPHTVENLLTKLQDLVAGVQSLAQDPPTELPPPFDSSSSFWVTFPGELFDELLLLRLQAKQPTLAALLQLAGVVEEKPVAATGARRAYVRRRIVWSNLTRLLSEPVALLAETYSWGSSDPNEPFEHALALANLQRLIGTLHPVKIGFPDPAISTLYYAPGNQSLPAVRELRGPVFRGYAPNAGGFFELGMFVLPIPAASMPTGKPVGLVLGSTFLGQVGVEFPAGPMTLSLRGGMEAPVGPRIELRPGSITVVLAAPAPVIDVTAAIVLDRGFPTIIFGTEGSIRVQVRSVSGGVRVLGAVSAPEFRFEFLLDELEFVLQFEDSDSFIQRLFGTEPQSAKISLAIRWSSKTGFAFEGGGAAAVILPLHLNLGAVQIDVLKIMLSAATANGLQIDVGLTGWAALGPVTTTVEGVGIRASFRPIAPDESPGNLGTVNVNFGFKPPDGVGLAIDAGVVVGGGFLLFDPVREEYAGVVQVELAETLNLTGIGLLTTRMPDGSRGFSLLVILTAEFAPPLQLGYGFALQAVGGLVAVNRTVALEALRAGLRAGSLGSILFPKDPIRNAPQIISDLRAIFPPAEGRFVIGPMLRIIWGTPTILTIDLALMLELPAPIRLFILGRLQAMLPEERFPVVRLRVDAVGAIDFGTGDVSLDAVLYDSRVAQFAITGELALRASFGARPNFALAVGGFHPRFQPPAGFPTLERVAINLATGDNPRLRLEAYLALTTNTVQFGARLELSAKAGDFSLGGFLSFDALVQFDPFGFVADLGALVALKYRTSTVMSVALAMTLAGPTPWHAWGQATFTFLFISTTVNFDVRIGADAPPPLPAPVQLRPLLLAALADRGNWATQLPPGEHPLVTFREDAPGAGTLAHPLASLEVRQRVAPLGVEITRFGNTLPAGERTFTLGVIGADGVVRTRPDQGVDPVFEQFAPAQFREMSDEEKIYAPAFEPLQSGVRFVPRGYRAGPAVVETNLAYEEHYEEPIVVRQVAAVAAGGQEDELSPPQAALLAGPRYQVPGSFIERVAAAGAAGQGGFRRTGRARYQVDAPVRPVRVYPPDYGVALDQEGGAALDLPLGPQRSYTAAMDALRKRLREHPEERGRLKVRRGRGGQRGRDMAGEAVVAGEGTGDER